MTYYPNYDTKHHLSQQNWINLKSSLIKATFFYENSNSLLHFVKCVEGKYLLNLESNDSCNSRSKSDSNFK